MKKIILLFLIYFINSNLGFSQIQNYYVDASNPLPGNGSTGNPWNSFDKTVWDINSLEGTIVVINVAPGTYNKGTYSSDGRKALEVVTNTVEVRLARPSKAISGDLSEILEFNLEQNYPNPFNPSTEFSFSLPSSEYVTLKVYDILGREVSKLIEEKLNVGVYKIRFDGSRLSSGIYFYSLNTIKYNSVKKMQLIK
jgi:hypothetical protein